MERRTKLVAIGAVAVLFAVGLYVAYDFNGHSLDFSDRETRIIVTSSMDGSKHPEHWYACETCGYESLGTRVCPYDHGEMSEHDVDISAAPLHSLVMIKHLDSDEMNSIHAGDVISFNYHGRLTIHRVTDVHKDASGNTTDFITKGDAVIGTENPSVDDVTGIVVGDSQWMGEFVHFVQSKTIIFIMIIAVLFVIFSVILDLVRTVLGRKKKTE